MTRSRWFIAAISFAAMIGVSVWIVRSALIKHGSLPALPLWAHAAALGFVLLEIAARSLKFKWGAKSLAIPMSFSTALRTSLGGDFASSLTPSRTGAEPARYLVLAESKMPVPDILMVLFLELVIELATLVALALGFWLLFHGSGTVLGLVTTIIAGYAGFLVAVGATGLVLARRSASGPPPVWARSIGFNAGRWRAIQRALRHLRTSIHSLRRANPAILAAAFGISLVHGLARLAVLPAIVWSIDRSAELSGLVLWPLVLLYGGSIAPAPGGGGAIEFGYMKAFEGLLSPPVLAASLIWWRFYTMYVYIGFGALAGGTTVFRALRPDAGSSQDGRRS